MGGQGWRGCRRAVGALVVCAAALAAPAVAQASVSVNDVSVTEGSGGTTTATFTLTRNAGLLAGATSVAFTTANGSAVAPADYLLTRGTRDFPGTLLPATQVQHVSVTVEGDLLDEPTETFALVVSGAEVGDGNGVATVADDDAPPVARVTDAAPATEGGTAPFAVLLSAPSGRDVSVAFATADGSAVAGQDYTARSGTLTIPAGSIVAAVNVALIDDSADEPAETFQLRLSAPTAATLGNAAATATIVDNDEPPVAAVAPPPPVATPPRPPALVLPLPSPSSGSSVASRLVIGNPRLRQPSTGLVTIACPPAAGTCSGQVTLFTRPSTQSKVKPLRRERRLGQRKFTLAGGATTTLSFVLSRADRRLLERAGRMNVRAFAVFRDSAGRGDVRSASGVLLRRTAHSSPSAKRASAAGEGLGEVGGALGAVVGRGPGL
jgi:hypothetical protein